MERSDLTGLLRGAYDKGTEEKTVVEQMLVFGVRHAVALKGFTHGDLSVLCAQAGIPPSLGTEIRKGVRIAKFVDLKAA